MFNIFCVGEDELVVWRYGNLIIVRAIHFLPEERRNEIFAPENFITDDLQVMPLIVIRLCKETARRMKQPMNNFDAVTHKAQPDRMFEAVIVVGEGGAG